MRPKQNGGASPRSGSEQEGAPPVRMVVRLEMPDKPVREFTYDFEQDVISLGRDPGNDIQIPLTTVSRRHARIFYELGDYFLEDLGSTHGSNHNDRKLSAGEKRLLRDGDTVSIMAFNITFHTSPRAMFDRQPGEKTEQLARRMVEEVLASLGDSKVDSPALRVMTGPDEGLRFELSEGRTEVVIGRSPECDLPLNDQNISRRHCLIKKEWHGYTAQDLGSKNGVLVNDKKIEGAQLIKDGDELVIGGIKLIFIDPPSRLLDQMAGPSEEDEDGDEAGQEEDPFTSGTEDVSDSEHQDEEEHAHEEEDAPPDDDDDDAQEDLEDPDVEDAAEPEEEGDESQAGDNPKETQNVASPEKSGAHAEIVILIVGALCLLVAVGVILFLMM